MNHPDMPPEVFVRLRLHGLTTEGMRAIDCIHPNYENWEGLAKLFDNSPHTATMSATYWNKRAQELKADGQLD